MTTPLLPLADRASATVDAAALGVWRDLLAILRTPQGLGRDYHRLLALLHELPHALAAALHDGLQAAYIGGWRHGVDVVRRTAPVRQLTTEGRSVRPGTHTILEDDRDQPSQIERLLFPAPDKDWISRLLHRLVQPLADDWRHIGTDSVRHLPGTVANVLATSIARGETQQQTAKLLRPLFDGSRVRARRVARTLGLHVAHAGQMEAWQGLGPLVIGYQLHAAKIRTSRPWHTARDGVIYYRDPGPGPGPGPGQKGMASCPHPPFEPQDRDGCPPGAPQIAWNCLCFLTPVLRSA